MAGRRNNRAQNPKDWSAAGAPQAGDTLQIRPTVPNKINPPGVDIALSRGAVANIQAVSGYVGQVYY